MRTSQSYLTPDEVIAVLKAAKERCARDWTMVLLDYRHGMRASEVCNVRLDDIDLKRQAITVRRLRGSLDTVQPLYPHRGVPLLDELAALRAYLRDRDADWLRFPVRVPERRQASPFAVLPVVLDDCRVCGVAHRQTASARSKTQPGVAPSRWQRESGADQTGARPQSDQLDDDLRRHVGFAGEGGNSWKN
jgi:integrase-like protein